MIFLIFLKINLSQVSKRMYSMKSQRKNDIKRAQANRYKYYTIPGSLEFHVWFLPQHLFHSKDETWFVYVQVVSYNMGHAPVSLQVHNETSQATLRSAHLQEDESINNCGDKTNSNDYFFWLRHSSPCSRNVKRHSVVLKSC